jgi:hypothetical protein
MVKPELAGGIASAGTKMILHRWIIPPPRMLVSTDEAVP